MRPIFLQLKEQRIKQSYLFRKIHSYKYILRFKTKLIEIINLIDHGIRKSRILVHWDFQQILLIN